MKLKALIPLVPKLGKVEFTANQLIVLTALYIALIGNIPFTLRVAEAVTGSDDYSLPFLISVPVLLVMIMIIFNSVVAIGKLLKPVLIALIMVSTLMLYVTSSYGTVFDYTMVQNMFESDAAEAFSYLNLFAVGFVLAVGGLPSALIYRAKVKKQSIARAAFNRVRLLGINVILVVCIVGVFSANFASVSRNNSKLVNYITPFKLFDASVKYAKRNYFSPPLVYSLIDNAPELSSTAEHNRVTVLVVGETARAQSFSLNGYEKNTNAFTQGSGIISFSNVSSCGTATAVSLPCMFSRFNRATYDKRHAVAQQNALDVAALAGVDVLWIDNNNGSCKGVCARVNTISIPSEKSNPLCDGEYCLDEALLLPLADKLKHLTHQDTLIVLHMMGSHGPTYFKRYADKQRLFTPDCQRSDIQNCSHQSLVNTYDNTIAYSDFVLSEIILQLDALAVVENVQTTMLYVSDHGESLGEKGLYLHGMPYALAPTEQTHVPLLLWQNDAQASSNVECLQAVSSEPISHDNLFDMLLGITSVRSTTYQADSDILAKCRTSDSRLAKVKTSSSDIEINN